MRLAIEFTLTVSKCLSCHFCPMDKLNAAYTSGKRVFTAPDFRTVLDKIPQNCEVHFSGMSEPTLHPMFAEFVKIACDTGRETHIYTTLAGLTQKQLPILQGLPVKYVRLRLPDAKGLEIPAQRWLEKYRVFRAVGIHPTAMAMTNNVDPEIIATLKCDGIEVDFPAMLSRAANLTNAGRQTPISGPITCSMSRWHQNVVFPDLSVVGCCQLYSREIVLGNLGTDSYQAIYDRAEEWAKDTTPPADSPCRVCDWAKPL